MRWMLERQFLCKSLTPFSIMYTNAKRSLSNSTKATKTLPWQGHTLYTNPMRQPLALLINHLLFDENMGERAVESYFFVLSANISPWLILSSFSSLTLSVWHIMLEQQRSLMVYVEMAKGNRANVQHIYHPQTGCVGAGMFVYAAAHKTWAHVGLSVYWSDHRCEHCQIHWENV